VQVLNAANELQDLILGHHRLLNGLRLWHGHVFRRISKDDRRAFPARPNPSESAPGCRACEHNLKPSIQRTYSNF
jgi:hypothetical protein